MTTQFHSFAHFSLFSNFCHKFVFFADEFVFHGKIVFRHFSNLIYNNCYRLISYSYEIFFVGFLSNTNSLRKVNSSIFFVKLVRKCEFNNKQEQDLRSTRETRLLKLLPIVGHQTHTHLLPFLHRTINHRKSVQAHSSVGTTSTTSRQ